MNASEKLSLILKSISGEEKIEVSLNCFTWTTIAWDKTRERLQNEKGSHYRIDDLLRDYFYIRSIPKLPKLTDEEKEFLKWFPQDWWIVRQKDGDVDVFERKPYKGIGVWAIMVSSVPKIGADNIPHHPPFANIKWSDEDCYTIGELRK